MECYLGIDLGTSSVRVLALRRDGRVLGVQGRDYPIREPRPGFAEQDPEEWWSATVDCTRRLLSLESMRGAAVHSIGLSGQMHGLVLLDREGKPLRDAIIWPDRRTAEICRGWTETIGTGAIGAITGLPLATGFMAPSLSWVKKNEPQVYRRAACVVLPKDYIRYRLTGRLATDVTDASGSLLFDVTRREWSRELVAAFELDAPLLPPVIQTTSAEGEVTTAAAAETGLPSGTRVAAGGADIAMASLALGVGEPGPVAVSISTGGTVVTGVDRLVLDRRLHTFCGAMPDRWILMGASLSAGLSLSWFARNVAAPLGAAGRAAGPGGERAAGPAADAPIVETLSREAAAIPAGSEGLLFAPYLCGERTPYMDPHARGCFIGLSLRHTHAHMARAIMEGVSYSLCDSLDLFRELKVPVVDVLCSGGGARSPVWRQILADVFDQPVQWHAGEEHSAIGAAMVGALAVGSPISRKTAEDERPQITSPSPEAAAVHRKQHEIFRRIHPQLTGVFEELARLQGAP